MATLQKINFNRYDITNEKGSNNNCVPSIFAAFLNIGVTESEEVCIGFPAGRNRKKGGTRITWQDPAEQFRQSYGIFCSNIIDGTNLLNWNHRANGTLSQAVKKMTDGAYVCIHKGHAFGVLIVDGKAYTVDYGKGNGARRIVWTMTKLDSVDARAILAKLQGKADEPKPEKRTYTLRIPVQTEVPVKTQDGCWHRVKTAEDSVKFCREHGNDETIPTSVWDKVHALQFEA